MLPRKTKSDYELLVTGGTVVEEDHYGIKVMSLPGERMLKLFRRRRVLSSQIWAPHARRFARNARTLMRRGVPTVHVDEVFRVPHLERQAVLYRAIPGRTLRQALDEDGGTELLQRFGGFVAGLHAQGILFRSLHLGNVIVDEAGEFALIDIVDMRFRWFGPLHTEQRIRNFAHILRLEEDRRRFASLGPEHFIGCYLDAAQAQDPDRDKLEAALQERVGG